MTECCLKLSLLQNCWRVPGPYPLLTDTTLNSTYLISWTYLHNAKETGHSMFLQPHKGVRRNKATSIGWHPITLRSKLQIDQADDHWQSLIASTLCPQPYLFQCPILVAHPNPHPIGNTDVFLHVKTNLCWQSPMNELLFIGISNSHDACRTLQLSHKTSNKSIKNTPTNR